MTLRSRPFFIVTCLAIFSVCLSLYKGSTPVTLYQLLFDENHQLKAIFLQFRLPRTLTAFVTGGLLALAGSLMQLLLQNPLADPYVLGISGGAALTTLTLMLLGASGIWLLSGAWAGSLLATLLIFALARKHRWQTHTLLLTGIALAGGFSAGISLILLLTPNASVHNMLFWLSGDLNDAQLPYAGCLILSLGLLTCLALAPGLDLLARGTKQAQALGLSTERFRIAIFLLSSLFTATAVTLAGCIGFIGLLTPHLTRLLTGYQHRLVLPLSVLLGGSLLTLADTFARTLLAPEQLPVGIVMALIGVPTFIWLLQK